MFLALCTFYNFGVCVQTWGYQPANLDTQQVPPLSCQRHIILSLSPHLPVRQDGSFQNFCGPFPNPRLAPRPGEFRWGLQSIQLGSQQAPSAHRHPPIPHHSPLVGGLGLGLLSSLLLSPHHGHVTLCQVRNLWPLSLLPLCNNTSAVWERMYWPAHSWASIPS